MTGQHSGGNRDDKHRWQRTGEGIGGRRLSTGGVQLVMIGARETVTAMITRGLGRLALQLWAGAEENGPRRGFSI
jgi:hypothetical protein